jgi:hypothetical protein
MSNPSIQLNHFSLSTPDDWNIASLIMVGPADEQEEAPGVPGGKFQQNVVVVSEEVEEGETLMKYVQKQTSKLEQQNALHKKPQKMEQVDLGSGRESVLFEHVVKGPNGELVRQMQLLTLKERRLHALITSHLDGLPFETHKEKFRKMLLSVRFA